MLVILALLVWAQAAPPVRSISLPRLLATLKLGEQSPPLARQFTPRHAPIGTYEVFVADEPIDRMTSRLQRLAGSDEVEGAWLAAPAEIWEAFGTVGPYDRGRLARLYGGRRPSLARGPVIRSGAVVASLTLISPHPDAELTRLEPGTMTIATDLRQLP